MKIRMRLLSPHSSALFLGICGSLALTVGTAPVQAACTPTPSGLISWWPGEGSGVDESGGNNAQLGGAISFAPGLVGQAFNFGSSGGAATVPASSNLIVQSFTIEAWIYPLDSNVSRPIVEYGASNDQLSPLNLWINLGPGGTLVPGALYGKVRDSGGAYLEVSSAGGLITPGQWSHIAFTFDSAARTGLLYVNGLNVASNSSPTLIQAQTYVPVNLGYRPIGSGEPWAGRRYFGLLDEVSIYGRTLTAAELQSIYFAGGLGKCPVQIPPQVFSQPADTATFAGGMASFKVSASGTPPFNYQWLFGSVSIPGATASALPLTNVQPSQAGAYSVVVSNAYGVTISSNAVLTVNVAPFVGFTNGSFEYAFSGWSTTGGDLILGPPSQVAIGTDGTHAANIGAFDSIGSSISQLVNVMPGTNYTLLFDSAANGVTTPGLTSVVQVAVQASGQVIASTSFTDISPSLISGANGFTARQLSFTVPSNAYALNFSFIDQSPNGGKAVDILLDNVRLIETGSPQPPIVLTQPQTQTATVGDTVQFTVTAGGAFPLTYQWLFNDSSIPAATNSFLVLSNVIPAQGGNYSVIVSNVFGVALSSNAVLTINLPPLPAITNGSFEFGLNGWTSAGAVMVLGPPNQGAIGTDGTHAANIGAFDATGSSLSQVFNILPGTNYTLEFDTAANGVTTAGLTSIVQVVVQAGGQVLGSQLVTDISPATVGGSAGFTPRSLSFAVPTNVYSVSIAFLDESPNGGRGVDALLDNVRLFIGGSLQPPVVVLQPTNQTVLAGDPASFTVGATGTTPLTYQWRFNSDDIPGATDSILNLPDVSQADAGSYSVVVSNAAGIAISSNAVLTVNIPLFSGITNGSFEYGLSGWTTAGAVLVLGPPSQSAVGTDGTHSADIGAFDATGSALYQLVSVQPGANYALTFDSGANGVTTAGLTSVVQIVVQAAASVIVSETVTDVSPASISGSNGFSSHAIAFEVPPGVTSVSVGFLDQSPNGGAGVDAMLDNVRMYQGPAILSQPQSVSSVAGGTVGFSVVAQGTQPISYQWLLNGAPISGATAASLSITNVQPSQAGTYSVLVSNPAGTIASSNAVLNVSVAPFAQVANGSFEFGLNGWTTVGGVLVLGPPNQSPIGTDGTHAADIGAFDSTGSALSQTVSVLPNMTYTLSFDSGANAIATAGLTSIVQVVVASGNQVLGSEFITDVSPGPVGGTNGFTPRTLSFTVPDQIYSVTLQFLDKSPNNGVGVDAMIDNVQLLTGGSAQAPLIVSQPQSQSVLAGANASFGVVASGAAPLSYQWQFNSIDIPGETAASLVLTNVQTSQAGNYAVVVSNLLGVVVSSNAFLTINQAPFTGVTNGSFEFGLTGWTTVGAVLDLGPPAQTPTGTDGTHSANIGAFDYVGAAIYQTVNVLPGTNYVLSFDTAANGVATAGLTSIVQVVVMSGGTRLASEACTDISPPLTAGTNGFTPRSLSFVVPRGAYSISIGFLDQSPNAGRGVDALVDNVRLTPGGQIIPPSILVQPVAQTVGIGSSVLFTVAADGTGPLTYEWQFNGQSITGADSSSLGLTNVQLADAGSYSVLISNVAGFAFSSNALLTVLTIQTNCTPAPSGLISWWPGNGNATDVAGGNSGVLLNGATFAPGLVGQAFDFTAPNQVVQVADTPSLNPTTALTLEAWILVSGVPATNSSVIIGKDDLASGRQYEMDVYQSGTQLVLLGNIGVPAGFLTLTGTHPISLNTWTHVAMTFDGALLGLYVNGTLDSSAAMNGPITIGTAPLKIGGLGAGPWSFLGEVDELSLYNRALSISELQSVYNAGAAGKCTSPVAPIISVQPLDQTVAVGQPVRFTVSASGTQPLYYQWRFNGVDISGATSSTLILTNAMLSQAGNYSVIVSNSVGIATSANALLSVSFAPATIQLLNSNVAAGSVVALPIVISANGNENALGFSLNFDPSLLTYSGVTLDAGLTGAALLVNTNLAGNGMLGVALALPTGITFAAGTQQIAVVSFNAAALPNGVSTLLSFGDQPTKRQLSDAQANTLSASFIGATISIGAAAIEGDVSPRPAGDGAVTITDWVLIGRFAAGLDSPTNASEFQRADCAPRGTLGDGFITVADWVQAGRYAIGLDPLTMAGGPTNSLGPNLVVTAQKNGVRAKGLGPRQVSVVGGHCIQGQSITLFIDLEAQGDENALGFSIAFDPTSLSFVNSALGADAAGATLDANTSSAGSGRLAYVLGLPPGTTFAAGTRQLLRINFTASPSAVGTFPVSLTDQPVIRQVVDSAASTLSSQYANGSVEVDTPPSLEILRADPNIILSWPAWGTNFLLQEADGFVLPTSNWTNVPSLVTVSNSQAIVTIPISGTAKFYRLQQQ